MTAALLEFALPRLRRSLGADEEQDELLIDKLELAAEEILRYLGRSERPDYARGLLVELAALRCIQSGTGGKKSVSYAEGQLSQKEDYAAPAEVEAGVARLLGSLAPYRVVKCRGVEQ